MRGIQAMRLHETTCAGIITTVLVLSVGSSALAQPRSKDKRGFTLSDPTPRQWRRDLSADRPDFTESPYTVDAGAVQLEMSFFDYAKNGDADAWAVAPLNLKVGLFNDVDLQFVVDPYVRQDDGSMKDDGFGDIQLRLKINVWGNDGGQTAFAFMPFIKIPTAHDDLGNDHVEGGLIFPFAIDLGDGVGLGLMFEIDFVFNDDDDNYETEFVTTAVIGFDLTDQWGVYVEGIGITSTESDVDFRGILGLGATFAVTQNLIFDAGVNVGLAGEADDVNVFSGMTIRF